MPSTKAAGGGIFSGVFIKDVKVQLKVKEDFELSWYLFFQQLWDCACLCYAVWA